MLLLGRLWPMGKSQRSSDKLRRERHEAIHAAPVSAADSHAHHRVLYWEILLLRWDGFV